MFRVNKEDLNTLYTFLVFLVGYIIIATIAMRPVASYDGFWHLQMGKDLVENGLSPWIDHYSFSFYGKEISTVPVIFQVLLYKFVSVFGESKGFYFLKLLYITVLMSVIYVYFRRIKAGWFVAFVLLPIILYFLQLRLLIRPEIFSNVLVVVCLMLYLNAQKKFATRELVYICLLLLFWVNYHSPIIGYMIIFGLFLEKAIDKLINGDDSFSWKFWFIWGVVIFLIGFIRPGGQHFLISVYSVLTEDFAKYTKEYRSSYITFSLSIIVHASWMLSIYVAIWSLIKKQYGFTLIAVLLTYFSLTTIRMLSVAMLINFCIMALYVSDFYNLRGKLEIRSSIKNILLVVATGLSVWTTYVVSVRALDSIEMYKDQDKILESRYPVKLVDYMNRYQEEGNVLNIMHFGGFLINKLKPGFNIYFDGRTNILYPIDFFIHNIFLLRNSTELHKAFEKYDVKYALFANTPETFTRFKTDGTLILNYADEKFLLFSEKKKNSFPIASTLLVFPSCWKDDWAQGISKELELSKELFEGNYYELQFILAFMESFLSSEDKRQFIEGMDLSALNTDGVRRVASYFALRAGSNDVSNAIFESIQLKNEYDLLLQSYHLALNGEYVDAENLLHYFYTVTKYIKKKDLAFDKIAIMIQVLDVLGRNYELQKFDVTYKAELEEKLGKVNYSLDNALSFEHVCE